MENCLDVYKRFPKEQRAMVSATFLDLSDPDLLDDPKTFIRYDKPNHRIIDLYFASKRIKSVAVKRIVQILKEHPTDKLMVAFNSVSGCYDLAIHLNKYYKVANEDIRILSSKNSEAKVGLYHAELNSDVLPAKIIFVTSAYFTGFDLHERYHLVCISWNMRSGKYNFQSLSDKRIKQIAGRCRDSKGLLSESIVYDILPDDSPKEKTTVKDLLDAANKEIAALNCIKRHYSNHPLLRENVENIRKLVAGSTETRGYKLVRMKAGEPIVSYLNLDAYLEMESNQTELYSSKETLAKRLKEAGHKVKEQNLTTQEEVKTNALDKKSRNEEIKAIIQKLRELDPSADPLPLMEDKENPLSQLQKYIVKQYAKLHGHLKPEPLLSLIEKAGDQRDSRMLNNLFFAAYYFVLDDQAQYKRLVHYHFPLGGMFTPEELFRRWNTIYLECGTLNELTSTTQAIRVTKLH